MIPSAKFVGAKVVLPAVAKVVVLLAVAKVVLPGGTKVAAEPLLVA